MIHAPNLADVGWLTHGFGTRHSSYPAAITTIRQIHSAIVLDARGRKGEVAGEGDALISNEPGITVGVRTADCVPILLADVHSRVVASIHAGWRGTAELIAARTVQDLIERWDSQPRNIRAAIGPAIGACCYEVGNEVAHRFGISVNGHVHLDLKMLNQRQLRAAGVADIWQSGVCTFCEARQFFSFRREREAAGRMLSFIGILPSGKTGPKNTSGGSRRTRPETVRPWEE